MTRILGAVAMLLCARAQAEEVVSCGDVEAAVVVLYDRLTEAQSAHRRLILIGADNALILEAEIRLVSAWETFREGAALKRETCAAPTTRPTGRTVL